MLVLMTNRKSHMRFRLVSKSTTLDDPERPFRTLFQSTCVFGAQYKNLNEDRPILSAQRCSAMTVISGNKRLANFTTRQTQMSETTDVEPVDKWLLSVESDAGEAPFCQQQSLTIPRQRLDSDVRPDDLFSVDEQHLPCSPPLPTHIHTRTLLTNRYTTHNSNCKLSIIRNFFAIFMYFTWTVHVKYMKIAKNSGNVIDAHEMLNAKNLRSLEVVGRPVWKYEQNCSRVLLQVQYRRFLTVCEIQACIVFYVQCMQSSNSTATGEYQLSINQCFYQRHPRGVCNGQVGMWRPILWTSK